MSSDRTTENVLASVLAHADRASTPDGTHHHYARALLATQPARELADLEPVRRALADILLDVDDVLLSQEQALALADALVPTWLRGQVAAVVTEHHLRARIEEQDSLLAADAHAVFTDAVQRANDAARGEAVARAAQQAADEAVQVAVSTGDVSDSVAAATRAVADAASAAAKSPTTVPQLPRERVQQAMRDLAAIRDRREWYELNGVILDLDVALRESTPVSVDRRAWAATPLARLADSMGTPGVVDRVAVALMREWARVDPASSVAQYPTSYVANFADMARVLVALGEVAPLAKEPGPGVHDSAGENAESCSGCQGTNPPYPWLCPGDDRYRQG